VPSFREMGMKCRVEGFHRHHIIPINVIARPAFSILFGNLRAIGFDPDDFATNGMHLPCTEQMAAIFDLPMHRGSHPTYNEIVSERVAIIAQLGVGEAYVEIRRLQKLLRKGVRRRDMLTPRDTFGAQIDFRTLEAEAILLNGFIDTAFAQ
jgi:A nuclease family of the HNH/ENDO VII superfamily with conserved AHH